MSQNEVLEKVTSALLKEIYSWTPVESNGGPDGVAAEERWRAQFFSTRQAIEASMPGLLEHNADPRADKYFDQDYMRTALASHRDLLKQYNEERAAYREYNQICADKVNLVRRARQDKLNNILNDVCRELGIPYVSLNTTHLGDGDAAYKLGTGRIFVHDEPIRGGGRPDLLIKNLMHELEHNEQDSLLVRKIANDVTGSYKILPNEDQLNEIQHRYKEVVGQQLEHGYMLKSLEGNRQLSDVDLARVAEFEKSFRQVMQMDELRHDRAMSSWAREKLSEEDGASLILDEALAPGNELMRKRLFGEPPSAETQALIDYFRSPRRWDETAATRALESILEKRQIQLNQAMDELYQTYRGWAHEQQASAVGELAWRKVSDEYKAAQWIHQADSVKRPAQAESIAVWVDGYDFVKLGIPNRGWDKSQFTLIVENGQQISHSKNEFLDPDNGRWKHFDVINYLEGRDRYYMQWPDGRSTIRFPDGSRFETFEGEPIRSFLVSADGRKVEWHGDHYIDQRTGTVELKDKESGTIFIKHLDGKAEVRALGSSGYDEATAQNLKTIENRWKEAEERFRQQIAMSADQLGTLPEKIADSDYQDYLSDLFEQQKAIRLKLENQARPLGFEDGLVFDLRSDSPNTPELFTLQQRHDLAARVESALNQNDRPITREQLKELLNKYPEGSDERKIALAIIEQSAPNMNSRRLDEQMLELKKQIAHWQITQTIRNKATGEYEPRITVYTLDGSSDGNMLAHIFQKNAGPKLHVHIEPLTGENLRYMEKRFADLSQRKTNIANLEDKLNKAKTGNDAEAVPDLTRRLEAAQKALEKLSADPSLSNILFFDDISKATPEQLKVISQVNNLMLADMNGYSRGLNSIDVAVSSLTGPHGKALEEKLDDLVKQISKLRSEDQELASGKPPATLEEVVSKVLRGDIPGELSGNPSIKRYVSDEWQSRRSLRRGVSDNEAYRLESIHNEAGQKLVSKEQVYEFFGWINAQYEKAKTAGRVVPGSAADYESAIATGLEHGLNVNTYNKMVEQSRRLHEQIMRQFGLKPEETDSLLIVTGFEGPHEGTKEGSQYLVNHLYARVNGLDHNNFISVEELRALIKNPAEAERRLSGKKLAFIDDYANTGSQQAKFLKRFDEDILSRLKDTQNNRVVNEFTIASLGRHHYEEDQNPWRIHGPGAHLEVHTPAAEEYHDFFSERHPSFRLLGPNTPLYVAIGISSAWSASTVRTAIVTPYGGPNNNILWMQPFIERYLNLPKRYPDKDWQLFPPPKLNKQEDD